MEIFAQLLLHLVGDIYALSVFSGKRPHRKWKREPQQSQNMGKRRRNAEESKTGHSRYPHFCEIIIDFAALSAVPLGRRRPVQEISVTDKKAVHGAHGGVRKQIAFVNQSARTEKGIGDRIEKMRQRHGIKASRRSSEIAVIQSGEKLRDNGRNDI